MAKYPWNVMDAITREILPGEVIRWTGQPTCSAVLINNTSSICGGFIMMAVGGGSLILKFGGWQDLDYLWLLFSSIFPLIGFGTIAKVVLDVFAARRTAYAITDRRVIIVSRLFRKRVLSFGQSAINAIEVRKNLLGSGVVIFRREITNSGDGNSTLNMAFLGISDVTTAGRELERLRYGSMTGHEN